MPHERLVTLLRGHRVRIARALVRQCRALVPRYAHVDEVALEHSFLLLLVGVENLLDHGEERQLLKATAHIAELRASTGFRVDDFVLAALAFLPVLRRFIIERAPHVEAGLDDYESFEAVALPVIGRAASIFMDATEERTAPNERPGRKSPPRGPMRIERVVGTEEDEALDDQHPFVSSLR